MKSHRHESIPPKKYSILVKNGRYRVAILWKEGDQYTLDIDGSVFQRSDSNFTNFIQYLEYHESLRFFERKELRNRFPETDGMSLTHIAETFNTMEYDPYPTFEHEDPLDISQVISGYTKDYSMLSS